MPTQERVALGHARVTVHQERPVRNEETGQVTYQQVGEDTVTYNLIPNMGRLTMHVFCYGQGPRGNGFNYIALSSDGSDPLVTDLVLSGEFVDTSGLARASGTVTLPTLQGNHTTISHTFMFQGQNPQIVQKAALFTDAGPPPSGVMNHEVRFEQKTLQNGDTLTLTFDIVFGDSLPT